MFLYRNARNRFIRSTDWRRDQQPKHERRKDQFVSHRSPPSGFVFASRFLYAGKGDLGGVTGAGSGPTPPPRRGARSASLDAAKAISGPATKSQLLTRSPRRRWQAASQVRRGRVPWWS